MCNLGKIAPCLSGAAEKVHLSTSHDKAVPHLFT